MIFLITLIPASRACFIHFLQHPQKGVLCTVSVKLSSLAKVIEVGPVKNTAVRRNTKNLMLSLNFILFS